MDELRVRRPARPDAAGVARLVSAYDAGFGLPDQTAAGEVLDDWATCDLAHDAWIVDTPDPGEAVAYALVDRGSAGILRADGYVHPSWAGKGLGSMLIELTEERARHLAADEAPGHRIVLHNTTLLTDGAAQALLERAGYRPVNWSYRMAIELREEPDPPTWPDGMVVRSLDRDRDLDAFHDAVSEAFAGHFGGLRTIERLRAEVAGPDFDPSLWFVAEDGPEIAGTVECLRRAGRGHVRYLGVRAPWRGRGLGLALLEHGLRELFRRGERRVALGVDANNATGAVRLYERAGMSTVFGAVTFEKELRPGREAAGR